MRGHQAVREVSLLRVLDAMPMASLKHDQFFA
jgi:hypothetical protein